MTEPLGPVSKPPALAAILPVQIIQTAVKPTVTVNEMAAVCQNDPVFVVRLLAHVNSASLARGRRITSVHQAVTLLGLRGVRNLALSTCVTQMAPVGVENEVLLAICLRRAVACRLVAQALGRRDAEDYFTTGLLLELGLLVRARDDTKEAVDLARAPAAARPMLERATGSENHPRRGALIARAWGLDPEVVSAIASHHAPEPPQGDLAPAAWLAERVAAVYEGGDVSGHRIGALAAAKAIGMPVGKADEILKAVPRQVSEIASDLRRSVGPQVELDLLLRDANALLVEMNRSYAELVMRLEEVVRDKEQAAEELRKLALRLEKRALTDDLTEVPNRRAFDDLLRRDLARADRAAAPLSLVLVGVDGLERVARERDAQERDEERDGVLKAVARALTASTRASDVVARVDEACFALILPNTTEPGARVVVERLRARIDAHIVPATLGGVAIGLGIASTQGPECRSGGAALVEAATRALHASRVLTTSLAGGS